MWPLRIWSHLLKNYLMENFIFCAMLLAGRFFVIIIIVRQISIIVLYFPFMTEKWIYYSNFDWQNFGNVLFVKLGMYQTLRPMRFCKCPVNIVKCRKFCPPLVNLLFWPPGNSPNDWRKQLDELKFEN